MKLSTREKPLTDAHDGSVHRLAPAAGAALSDTQRNPAHDPGIDRGTAGSGAGPGATLVARAADAGPDAAAPPRTPEPAAGNAAIARLATGRAPHPVPLGALASGGARALRHLQPKLTVSRPGDRFEREADAVAAQVGLGPAAEAVAGRAPGLSRLATPAADAGDPAADAPQGLNALLSDPGPGSPIPPDVRARVESHLRFDLGGVQVHSSDRAAAGAAQLNARAFTTGGHIFLGAGESASDLTLMAHEATHVVQQQSVGVYRLGLQRDSDSLLPDWALAPLRSAVHAIPGYDMLTVVAAYDPIANRTVERTPENLVRGVLGLVPFGGVVAAKLQELGVLQDAYKMIDSGLSAHNLTLARFQHEVDQAWSEISVTKGIDGNTAVVTRHVDGLYNDALGFVRGIIDAVVQLIRDAAAGVAEKYLVGTPVWDLTKKVLHTDPLRGTPVNAPTVEILADFLKLIGKQDALAQMQERGTLQKTADWLDLQVPRFLGLINELVALFQAGWNAIQPENVANLADNLGKLARDAIALVQKIGAFAYDVIGTVLSLIKDALLEWLSRHAHQTRGFKLLTVIIGMDPFTGAPVPRSAENLIGGFITLLPNGEATYQKLAEAGVIADAAAQIEGAMARLGISADMIKNTFLGVWNMLTLEDLLNPIGAFLRVLDKFGEPLGRIVAFVGEVLKVVVTLILKLMNFPSELLGSIVANAMSAIEDIKRDPVAFFLNLLQALKTGLFGFLDKVLTYLLNGLADWLFRGLEKIGIHKPPDLSLKSILTLVLQVLGITTEMLWQKLGKQIGEENVKKIRAGLDMAGEAFAFIKDVEENGVGAIWKYVEKQLGNLWDTLLKIVMDWITKEIIEKATAKLLSMLDPTGIMAVVNSTIAFFKAVQSVIDYIREILQIINDYVSTLAAIAKGDIQAGAAKVEKGLANAVPVAIGFLANQAGLGSVPEELAEHVKELQKVIDEAVEWLFAQAKSLGQAALNAITGGGSPGQPAEPGAPAAAGADGPIVPTGKTPFSMDGMGHTVWFETAGGKSQLFMASSPGWLKGKLDKAMKDPAFPSDGLSEGKKLSDAMGKLEDEIPGQETAYQSGTKEIRSECFGGEFLTKAAYRQKVTDQVSAWRTQLETAGTTLHLKDLENLGHRSRYVEGDAISQGYRGYPLWRDTFYGDWASGVRQKFETAAFQEGLDYWRGLNPGAVIPSGFDLYRCKDCGEYFSSRGRVEGYEVRQWTLDHKKPVVEHFQDSGLTMVQTERETWYNLESNLEGLCRNCNHESLRVEKWTATRRFRGPSDAPPDPSDNT
ncbi:DUF4157 domain-containing protein [Krasilnikovia sp. MM14-A1259]|uniref:eCIS core domain-containing protein n=1 Tax=Krasilnikovia sp. MM14-A1259 TaxID=3373539 RepID=UPI0037FED5AC